jgi:hypothetical protein
MATTCIERNLLLAEVNRLSVLVKPPRGQKSDWFDHGWAIGKASENARILAAVEALPFGGDSEGEYVLGWEDAKAHVLAIVGERKRGGHL